MVPGSQNLLFSSLLELPFRRIDDFMKKCNFSNIYGKVVKNAIPQFLANFPGEVKPGRMGLREEIGRVIRFEHNKKNINEQLNKFGNKGPPFSL
jgi:hypothetical protein